VQNLLQSQNQGASLDSLANTPVLANMGNIAGGPIVGPNQQGMTQMNKVVSDRTQGFDGAWGEFFGDSGAGNANIVGGPPSAEALLINPGPPIQDPVLLSILTGFKHELRAMPSKTIEQALNKNSLNLPVDSLIDKTSQNSKRNVLIASKPKPHKPLLNMANSGSGQPIPLSPLNKLFSNGPTAEGIKVLEANTNAIENGVDVLYPELAGFLSNKETQNIPQHLQTQVDPNTVTEKETAGSIPVIDSMLQKPKSSIAELKPVETNAKLANVNAQSNTIDTVSTNTGKPQSVNPPSSKPIPSENHAMPAGLPISLALFADWANSG